MGIGGVSEVVEDSGVVEIYRSLVENVDLFSSVQSDSLRLHGLQQARPPCTSPTPGAYANSCPLSL